MDLGPRVARRLLQKLRGLCATPPKDSAQDEYAPVYRAEPFQPLPHPCAASTSEQILQLLPRYAGRAEVIGFNAPAELRCRRRMHLRRAQSGHAG